MLVQLPDEQTRNSTMVTLFGKWNPSIFKEDIGADSPFLNKSKLVLTPGVSNNTLDIWISSVIPILELEINSCF